MLDIPKSILGACGIRMHYLARRTYGSMEGILVVGFYRMVP